MVIDTRQKRISTWHVRMNGVVRGPFSEQQLNSFWRLGWFKSFHQASQDLTSWVPIEECLRDLQRQHEASLVAEISPDVPQPPVLPGGWLYRRSGNTSEAPVPFAVLQVLVSLGKLNPGDEVKREGWVNWVPVGSVRGLICGPPQWCSVCDAEVHVGADRCNACGVTLIQFQSPHTGLILSCGILGLILFPVVPLWVLAICFGRYDMHQIQIGMMNPDGFADATTGVRLGWGGCALFICTGVFLLTHLAVTSLSVPNSGF